MRALAAIAAALLLASCGGGGGGNDDNGGGDEDPSVWHLRAINAVSDAPQVQFYVDDTAVAAADYGAATDYKPAHTGDQPVKVAIRNASKLETADPGYTDIGESETYTFDGPTNYTLVETGTVADPQQIVMTDTIRTTVEDNQIEYQVVNAATAGGTLGVYITAPGASIDAPQLVDTLAVGEYSTRGNLDLEVASGDEDDDARSTDVTFEVRQGSTTVFTSASVAVGEQSRLLIVIADNAAATGSSPVKLLVFSGVAAGGASVLLNTEDPGELRFANTSSDAGPIDLIVGDSSTDVFAPSVAFGTASPYGSLPAGTYNSIGTPPNNAGSFLFVNPVALAVGRSLTLYGQGRAASMRGLLFADDRRTVATEARFRFLYTAPTESGKAFDIYLVKRGEDLDLDAETPPTPRVSSLAYRAVSAQQILDGGNYDVYVTFAGESDVLAGPLALDLADGTIQTLALADDPGTGDLILLPFNDARE